MKIGNHITKVRSRHAVKPRAVQPIVMWTPALGRRSYEVGLDEK